MTACLAGVAHDKLVGTHWNSPERGPQDLFRLAMFLTAFDGFRLHKMMSHTVLNCSITNTGRRTSPHTPQCSFQFDTIELNKSSDLVYCSTLSIVTQVLRTRHSRPAMVIPSNSQEPNTPWHKDEMHKQKR